MITRNIVRVFLVFCISYSSLFAKKLNPLPSSTTYPQVADDGKRYLCIGLLGGSGDVRGTGLVEQAAAAGCNAVMIVIGWDQVYTNVNSTANWAGFDAQIKRCQELGLKICIRVNLSRYLTNLGGFWTNSESAIDGSGNKLTENGLSFSLGANRVVEKANGFVREVAERYNYVQQAGNLLTISATTTPTQEAGYHYQNQGTSGEIYSTVFDYSSSYQEGFRLWLQAKYKDIRRLNEAWSNTYDSFDDIYPPFNPNDLIASFAFRAGIDWYLFRHQMLKKFLDNISQTIKNVNPTYKVLNDYGSVYDGLSTRRGTLAFRDLGTNADAVKVNDAPEFPHRFATDLMRSNITAGKWVMNEMFPTLTVPIHELIRFEDECFEHGTKLINFVVAEKRDVDYFLPVIGQFRQRWLNSPLKNIVPAASMTVKLSELIGSGDGYGQPGYSALWRELYDTYKLPIEILLSEDVLQKEGNIAPTVYDGIANQSIMMGFDWRFSIPTTAFQDIDGFVGTYDITGLPSGLSVKNNTIIGTPTTAGKYKITVKGFDNSNASATTDFTLVVKTPAKIDLQLYKSGNVGIRKLIRSITNGDTLYLTDLNFAVNFIAIPAVFSAAVVIKMTGPLSKEITETDVPFALFGDNDGGILKVGKYTLTANSYSSTTINSVNGTGFQTLGFTVLEKKSNTAPVVQNGILNQTGKVGSFFQFNVPNNTFKDNENNISTIQITGLPTGLSTNNAGIYGTPTQKGTFVVTVTALDIEGLSVKTQFTLLIVAVNVPPVLEYTLADQVLLTDKKFKYDAIGYAFSDNDGSIAKIEVSGLPPGLTYKEGMLSGIATSAGVYEINVKATDNEGASTTVTFKMTVKSSNATFEIKLISAGDVFSRRQIAVLTDGKVIPVSGLPALINIYVVPIGASIDRIDFEISGAVTNKYSDLVYPYGLYGDEGGFSPKIGVYKLKIVSYLNGKINGNQLITFEIKN
jgi:hypothetical protein